MREQLGDEEHKKPQVPKKKEYRAKVNASKKPQQQQVVKEVEQQVVAQVAPALVKQVAKESKSKITNYFKPVTEAENKSQSKITSFFKPISKQQSLKTVKTEPIKDLIKGINTTIKKLIRNQKLL